MTTQTILFEKERETKGAVRYREVDNNGFPLTFENGARTGTLYLRKDVLGFKDAPLNLTVTVAVR